MAEEKDSYIKQQLEAVITKENNTITYHFQRARLRLKNDLEIQPLKEKNIHINKQIVITDDEVNISFEIPPSYHPLSRIQKKKELAKWMLAYQLTKEVMDHSLKRLVPFVCPENIIFDSSYTPYLLHYGVKDSLVPFENNEEQLFLELKATLCYVIEGKHTFEEYMRFHEILKASEEVKKIMGTSSCDELLLYLQEKMADLEQKAKSFITIPNKKWKLQRYLLIGFIVCFIPALFYTIYSLVFVHPKQEAYVKGNQAFLEQRYSEVITLLQNYNPESMPYVVQYQLASSYVASEALQEEQRKNVNNALTLQADEQFFLYWIYIGRGTSDKALTIARTLEDQDLVIYALINYEDEIKKDKGLKAEKKQELLDEIKVELADFKTQKEQEEKQLEEEQQAEQDSQTEQKNTTPNSTPNSSPVNSNPEAGKQPNTNTNENN